MDKIYRNIGFVVVLLIPLVIAGFYKTYLRHFPQFDNGPGIAIHLHFIISSLWILLLIIQPLLIRAKNYHQHRLLGRLSYLLFTLLLASIIPLYLDQLDDGFLPLLMLTTFDIVLLVAFYLLAMLHRKNSQVHMRYMIALIVLFTLPAIGRINSYLLGFSFIQNANIAFGITSVILFLLIVNDIKANANWRPFAIAFAGFAVRQLAIFLAYFELI